jgi:multidrug resistance efflux pump
MGQSFRRGDVLVGFDCVHQQAQLASSEAAQVKAEKLLSSKRSLAAMKAVSEMDVQLAEADLAQAKAQLIKPRPASGIAVWSRLMMAVWCVCRLIMPSL